MQPLIGLPVIIYVNNTLPLVLAVHEISRHFWAAYDDTFVLMKILDIPFVLNKFKSFDKNLQFTVDTFDSGKVHFLDLEISQSGINIYRKSTHTGQYTDFDSFEPWARKTAWIRSLFHRAVNICSSSAFLNQRTDFANFEINGLERFHCTNPLIYYS